MAKLTIEEAREMATLDTMIEDDVTFTKEQNVRYFQLVAKWDAEQDAIQERNDERYDRREDFYED